MKVRFNFSFLFIVMLFLAIACKSAPGPSDSDPTATDSQGDSGIQVSNRLVIKADYQIRPAFETTGIIQACESSTGVDVTMDYATSTSVRLANASKEKYDAFWATTSAFLANTPNPAVHTAKSYIGVAAYEEVARELGWDADNLLIQNVLDGLPAGVIKLGITNPSQTDPGASFVLASFTSMASQNMLTTGGLNGLSTDQFKNYFGVLENVLDSVESLKQAVLDNPEQYNTLVVYEATLVQLNKELAARGMKTFKFYYLSDATFLGSFPLAYTGNTAVTGAAFTAFSECLGSDTSAATLRSNGYRAVSIGATDALLDPNVFRADWGLINKDFPILNYPAPDTAKFALNWYQTALKPKLRAAFCFDYSGSMDRVPYGSPPDTEPGSVQRDNGQRSIFDQAIAFGHGLSVGLYDSYTVFAFASQNFWLGTVYGSDPASVSGMSETLANSLISGDTAMFDCAHDAVGYLLKDPTSRYYDTDFPEYDPENYTYAVYVLTDGDSTTGWEFEDFRDYYNSLPQEQHIKFYGVGFGNVDMSIDGPFSQFIELTGGKLIDGRENLEENLKLLFANQ